MLIPLLLMLLCFGTGLLVAALVRSPLVRMLSLSFDSWAERSRFDVGELS